MEESVQEYVYLFQAGPYGKIGCSLNPKKRLKAVMHNAHPDLPCDPSIAFVAPVTMARRLEATLHRYFKDKRVEGEWFVLDGTDIHWLCQQNNATLTELANSMQIRDYAPVLAPRPWPLRPVHVQFDASPEQLSALTELAGKWRRSVSWTISILIDEALAAHDKQRQTA